MGRNWKLAVAAAVVVSVNSLAAGQEAAAIGYYNLPGSFCQCFGYGNGAGHHSCLVLGPSTCAGFCSTNEVRLPHAPQPPCYQYGGCEYGAAAEASWMNSPTRLYPSGPEPLPEPTPAEYVPPQAMAPQYQHGPQYFGPQVLR
jgi:hypothetical protein